MGKERGGDKLGYTLTPEDLRLREVYRYWVHTNPRTHLDSSIGKDASWKVSWRYLVVMSSRHYDALIRKFGRRFFEMLEGELSGVPKRK